MDRSTNECQSGTARDPSNCISSLKGALEGHPCICVPPLPRLHNTSLSLSCCVNSFRVGHLFDLLAAFALSLMWHEKWLLALFSPCSSFKMTLPMRGRLRQLVFSMVMRKERGSSTRFLWSGIAVEAISSLRACCQFIINAMYAMLMAGHRGPRAD